MGGGAEFKIQKGRETPTGLGEGHTLTNYRASSELDWGAKLSARLRLGFTRYGHC